MVKLYEFLNISEYETSIGNFSTYQDTKRI